MVVRAEVGEEMLEWARLRAGLELSDLIHRFPKLPDWESGDVKPTLKQLEDFARATHTPIGYLLLERPPEEPLPIPDFRTMADAVVQRPSADLLDTIYQTQRRQEWYHDYAEARGYEPLAFVGSLQTSDDFVVAGATLRQQLTFGVADRGGSWSSALSILAEHAEGLGVLVMVNGVVGSNTHRSLDPGEFRGFDLVDALAPVIFVNGADTKAAQIFTMAHELAHLWLGETALSDANLERTPSNSVERWCNQVAAEFLVPLAVMAEEFEPTADLTVELDKLATKFRVSTLVVLLRLRDAGFIEGEAYRSAYQSELRRVLELIRESSGGNFYNTQPVRVSKLFARALISSTLEGATLYRDAFQMLGFRKLSTFNELSVRLGIAG